MKIYSEEDVERGLDCYDPEHRVFRALKQARKLNKRDVLLILKWKLGRIKESNSVTVNDENMEKINKAIEIGRSPERKCDALKMLERIPGIGLATATAILTVCYPDEFTIIDQRVLEELDLFPPKLAKHKPTKNFNTYDWTAEDYLLEYLPKVRECSERWGRTLRDTDRALWGLSVSRRIEQIIRS
jgi:thermostable 8-oxoguanine DNA glycosylase